MRLIDKIAKYGMMRDGLAPDISKERMETIFEDLREAVCVEVGNVAEWFFEEVPLHTRVSPMFLLPFDCMWLEYVNRWNWPTSVHIGVLLRRMPEAMAFGDAGEDLGQIQVSGQFFAQCEEVYSSPRVLLGENFVTINHGETLKRIMMEKFPHDVERKVTEEQREKKTRQIADMIKPTLSAISFFHCSNVAITNDYPDKPLSKRFEQKHGVPLRVMKTIDIHKPRNVRGRSPEAEHSERILQAHLVRGHFKRYNNLFGSIAGMWFWKPHVRGAGVPEKRDYEVFAPNEQHHGKCIVEERS